MKYRKWRVNFQNNYNLIWLFSFRNRSNLKIDGLIIRANAHIALISACKIIHHSTIIITPIIIIPDLIITRQHKNNWITTNLFANIGICINIQKITINTFCAPNIKPWSHWITLTANISTCITSTLSSQVIWNITFRTRYPTTTDQALRNAINTESIIHV